MAVAESYAGPGLRWGLMLEDHPGAWATFETRTGTDLGIPDVLGGGDTMYCVATVHFPEATGRLPVSGFKVIPADPQPPNTPNKDGHLSDLWQTLCTKALGRATGRAGYPANLPDLKALVVWRQRNTEIAALEAGTVTVALKAADPGAALDGAGKPSEDAETDDPPGTVDADGIEVAEVIDPDDDPSVGDADLTLVPPSPETLKELRLALGGLGPLGPDMTAWAREHDMRVTKPRSEDEAQRLLIQATIMVQGEADGAEQEALPVDPAAIEPPDADLVVELASGLNEQESRAYVSFLEQRNIDLESDPHEWSAEQITEVLGWLDPGGT